MIYFTKNNKDKKIQKHCSIEKGGIKSNWKVEYIQTFTQRGFTREGWDVGL